MEEKCEDKKLKQSTVRYMLNLDKKFVCEKCMYSLDSADGCK